MTERVMTTDPLNQFVIHLANHLANTTELPRDQAEVFIADLVHRARATYVADGAAYGDDAEGFLRWLRERVALRVRSA